MYERESRSGPGLDLPTASRHHRRRVPEVDAEPGLVVEDPESGFCGAVVGFEHGAVVLEDRTASAAHSR